jgi:hypothetical protein
MTDDKWPKCDCPDCVEHPDFSDDGGPREILDTDPWDDTLCDWPGCQVRGNPYEDKGWCWYPRYYLWLPEGEYCPVHTAFIEEGKKTGYFKDWPRDMSPDVLEFLDMMAEFVPLDSDAGQRIVRKIDADARRAAFRLVEDE